MIPTEELDTVLQEMDQDGDGRLDYGVRNSGVKRSIGEILQLQRRPLLGPPPGY